MQWCQNEQRSTQKVRKSVSEAGRGGEGKCKDLTGNQTINLLRVLKKTHICSPATEPVCKWLRVQVTAEPSSTPVSKSRGTFAPSPGRAVGRVGSSTNDWLRQRKEAVSTTSLRVLQTFSACFPQAKGDLLNASLTGAVPLQPQSCSPCSSVHTLLRKPAGKKKERKDWTKQFQEQQFQAGAPGFCKVSKAFQENIYFINSCFC